MDQDNNNRVLPHWFSPDPSGHAITGTRCSLANGLEIAIVVISQRVGDIEEFTATDSHNERATPDGSTLFFANMHADKCDTVKDKNGFGEGEIR